MPQYIEPLAPPYDDETSEQLGRLMGGSERPPLKLFATLAKHLPMARAWGVLGAHNLSHGALPVRDREIIILRTCYLNRCEYEWGVHARIYARAAGLSEAQWLATATADADGPWSTHDRDVLALADSLHARAALPADLRERLRHAWDEAQLLEACELAGFYHGVAFMANVAEVEREDWGARFPDAR